MKRSITLTLLPVSYTHLPCYIAEWKKMAGKNKKLIKKLEAKQKKALQRKFLSPECLMSLYQQSWQND